MKLIGIALRKPSFNEITAAAVMGAGLWVAAVGALKALHVPFGAADAGAMLLVLMWACIGARLGIRVGTGGRHLAANVAVSAMLFGLYQIALQLAA